MMASRSALCPNKPAVYVASYYFPDLAECVKEALPSVEIIMIPADSRRISDEDITTIEEKAEIVFADAFLIKPFIYSCKKLKWIQSKGAGVESILKHIDPENPPNFRLTRIAFHACYISEYVLMYILAIEKNLMAMFDSQNRRRWQQLEMSPSRVLSSVNVSILGVGVVGTEVAKRCKQFGMNVTGVGKTRREDKAIPQHFDHYTNNIEEALSGCDYLCSTLPSTPETRDLLSGQLLSACQLNKTTFISVGRGDVIDEATIVKAIRERWLRGAVLDVAPVEPLPDSSPLWGLKNVLITPHISGYNRAPQNTKWFVDEFIENYERYCSGLELKNGVDFKKGY